MNWYALHVETGKEEMVQEWLRYYFDQNTLTSIIPKRELLERKAGRTRIVLRTLFPGYVLIRVAMDYMVYHKISSIPNLIRIVRGSSYFSEIPDSEIEPIKQMIDDEGIINFSEALILDSKVIVISGPLKGREGLIQKIDKRKKRAKIKVVFNGLERFVDIGIKVLEPVM